MLNAENNVSQALLIPQPSEEAHIGTLLALFSIHAVLNPSPRNRCVTLCKVLDKQVALGAV